MWEESRTEGYLMGVFKLLALMIQSEVQGCESARSDGADAASGAAPQLPVHHLSSSESFFLFKLENCSDAAVESNRSSNEEVDRLVPWCSQNHLELNSLNTTEMMWGLARPPIRTGPNCNEQLGLQRESSGLTFRPSRTYTVPESGEGQLTSLQTPQILHTDCLEFYLHYPKTSFTIVTDTPENLRLRQQSELQSQIRRSSQHLSE
ncbi:hypothetical protein CRENBAI_020570 [Crenichthys baileyi]|uniref:Uncharacterized protein n=1 Tax=Crenichthys baileyi TaxID=28760 RepID=A0AAV9SHE4_9TELE